MTTNTTTAAADLYTAPIGPTKWRLVGIGRERAVCDHCDRPLVNTYTVEDPAGARKTLGRACVKKVTGYNLAQAEAARLLRVAAKSARRAEVWAAWAQSNPEHAALLVADINGWIAWYSEATGRAYSRVSMEWDGTLSGAGPADEVRGWIGEGRDWAFRDYMQRRRAGEFGHWQSAA